LLAAGGQEEGRVLILGILVLGLFAGWIAHLLVGRGRPEWGLLLFCGVAGSFVGGLLVSVLAGDGLALRPSGVVGSCIGATVLLAIVNLLEPGTRVRR
jgi:uncharacterized membrane protein YeaQ/YmgE (transglycosylase-associated protein family)